MQIFGYFVSKVSGFPVSQSVHEFTEFEMAYS